jgi:iron(III) transport system permease protein
MTMTEFRFDFSKPVLIAFSALLCVLILLPLYWLVYYSVTDKSGALTVANFVQLFTDPTLVKPLLTTLKLSLSVGLICCLVAPPIAWLVARTNMPFRRTVRTLVMASLVTPPFLGAIAWEILAAPNSGILNQWYREWLGLDPFASLFNIYTLTGLTFAISCYTFPYVFVLVANALDRMPSDLEDASSMLGGGTWHTARRITIPLVLPAILAGALIALLQAMTLFGSPAILALPAGFHTVTTKIWSLFHYPPKPGLAAAASLPLLFITVALLRAQHQLLGRRGYSVVGGKNSAPRLLQLGRWKWPAMFLCLLVLGSSVLLPYAALIKTALVRLPADPLTWANISTHNINFVFFEFSATQAALHNTFVLGALTATIGTALALVIAYLTARQLVRGHRLLGFLATAPVAIPGIVLGVGIFLSYTRPPLVLYGTLWILLLAYLTIELPAGYQQLQSAFRSIHVELEEASRILGANRLQSLRHITAPLLRSGVIATWCFIFIGVIRELSAAIILFTADTKVVSTIIYDLNESGDYGAISVLGLTMLAVTFAVIVIANRVPILGSGPAIAAK